MDPNLFNIFQASDPPNVGVGNHAAPHAAPPFFMQYMPTNADSQSMSGFFQELLAQDFQTDGTAQGQLEGSPGNQPGPETGGSTFDGTMPNGPGGGAHSQGDVTDSALQFAANHRTALTVVLDQFGMKGWLRLCHRLTLSYIARVGTESLRAFRQKREEDTVEFIVSEYEEMVREGVVPLEDSTIQIHGQSVRTCINVRAFRRALVEMISEIPRILFSAWLEAAKNIVKIICPFDMDPPEQSIEFANQLCTLATHHGIYTYNFFHDLPVSINTSEPLFRSVHARSSMMLALRNIGPLITDNGPNTFFGIYNRVRDSDGVLQFRLLATSSTHTTNLVSSMLLLVLDKCIINGRRNLRALSDRKIGELKSIYDANTTTFRGVMACSDANVPKPIQELARTNLLDILPLSP